MKDFRIRVATPTHVSIEWVESYILREYPGCEILYSTESILPDVLEDGTIIYVYYAHIRKE